jgi:Spy/CpxP family protein refolding chaperone
MNKTILMLAICLGFLAQAQQETSEPKSQVFANKKDFKNLPLEQKKEAIRKLREDNLVKEINIDPTKEEAFRLVFRDYLKSQKAVKSQFRKHGSYDVMTEKEAREQLENSFVIGQQLLDLRKKYTQEFLKLLTPNQVLKVFHSEIKMRESIERYRQLPKVQKENSEE